MYDPWCDYSVERWMTEDWEVASGTNLQPHWPRTSTTDCSTLDCTREGSQRSRDQLTLRHEAEDETHRCDVSERLWATAAETHGIRIRFHEIDQMAPTTTSRGSARAASNSASSGAWPRRGLGV